MWKQNQSKEVLSENSEISVVSYRPLGENKVAVIKVKLWRNLELGLTRRSELNIYMDNNTHQFL